MPPTAAFVTAVKSIPTPRERGPDPGPMSTIGTTAVPSGPFTITRALRQSSGLSPRFSRSTSSGKATPCTLGRFVGTDPSRGAPVPLSCASLYPNVVATVGTGAPARTATARERNSSADCRFSSGSETTSPSPSTLAESRSVPLKNSSAVMGATISGIRIVIVGSAVPLPV